LLINLVIESIAIGVLFGYDKLDALMKVKTGESFPWIMKVLNFYVTLPLLFVLMVGGLSMELNMGRDIWWT